MNKTSKLRILEDIENHAKPLIVQPAIKVDGIALETSLKGEKTKVASKGMYTSFDLNFHLISKNLCDLIGVRNCWNLLVRSNSEETKIFKDNLPIMLEVRSKRSIQKLQPIFDFDIADILELSFKDSIYDVNPVENEKVFCIISSGFIHGLYFDFSGELAPSDFKKEIGRLYRKLRYYNLYYSLTEGIIETLIAAGWFPFIQLIGRDLDQITSLVNDNKLNSLSSWVENTFPDDRIKEFTLYWTDYPAYKAKKKRVEEGIACFYDGKYAAAISTLTPLVEGLFNDYLIEKTGKGISYDGNKIVEQIFEHAILKSEITSLLFPKHFKDYLIKFFFKHIKNDKPREATRHVVGHGRGDDQVFTRERALQILLTLDQLFFYMDK